MVAKISSGNSIFAALSYNQKKVDEQQASILLTHRIIEPLDGIYKIGACIRSFEPYLAANRRTEKPILHISLNPDPKDVLSDEQLAKIARTYMQKLGYGNQPFIVYKHEDIERHHLHIVSVRIDENGKKLDHNFENRKSMEICRALEQQYKLNPADQKERSPIDMLKQVRYGEENLKAQIARVIRPVMKSYFFQSMGEYNALLSLYNITVEEVKTGVGDRPCSGLVYSAIDNKGNRIGKPFKSSLFGKAVGYEALQQRMQLSTKIISGKQLKERTKDVLTKVMEQHLCRTDFEKDLLKNGIQVVFRQNEAERIYGVTFIDHKTNCVLNGSRIGKAFSANIFNELFSASRPDGEKHPQHPGSEAVGHSFEPDCVSQRETDSLVSIPDFFNTDASGVDPEEEAFIRRMRKKKKRKKQQE